MLNMPELLYTKCKRNGKEGCPIAAYMAKGLFAIYMCGRKGGSLSAACYPCSCDKTLIRFFYALKMLSRVRQPSSAHFTRAGMRLMLASS